MNLKRAAVGRKVACSCLGVWLLACGALGQSSPSPLKLVSRPMLQQSSARQASNVVDHIVLHFCSDVLAHPDKPYDVDRQVDIFRKAQASANYLIARDGTVYLLVPENRVAWHAGRGQLAWEPALKSMNQRSIGIEMFAIGSLADMKLFGFTQQQYDAFKAKHAEWVGFSDAQYATLKQLLQEIRTRHPAIQPDRFHIIGHEEWTGRKGRTDPGELFDWARIGLTRERPAATQ
jgi:N-acetyl-anhydromuramyl-L-alanine amidase AmpD